MRGEAQFHYLVGQNLMSTSKTCHIRAFNCQCQETTVIYESALISVQKNTFFFVNFDVILYVN